MSDLVILAESLNLTGTGGTTYRQDIAESIDVSAYDSIDFQISLTADHVNGATVSILTSMQNKIDDMALATPSWYSIGSQGITVTPGVLNHKQQSVPTSSTNSPLLRYIRYQIAFGASTTNVTLTIRGLARRGLRVG